MGQKSIKMVPTLKTCIFPKENTYSEGGWAFWMHPDKGENAICDAGPNPIWSKFGCTFWVKSVGPQVAPVGGRLGTHGASETFLGTGPGPLGAILERF